MQNPSEHGSISLCKFSNTPKIYLTSFLGTLPKVMDTQQLVTTVKMEGALLVWQKYYFKHLQWQEHFLSLEYLCWRVQNNSIKFINDITSLSASTICR